MQTFCGVYFSHVFVLRCGLVDDQSLKPEEKAVRSSIDGPKSLSGNVFIRAQESTFKHAFTKEGGWGEAK